MGKDIASHQSVGPQPFASGSALEAYIPKTREALVADRLRSAILVGHFLPGEKLDQGLIAKQMDVSISPVREAIRTLSAEDLVTLHAHKGAFVTERTPEELEELHMILGLLEGAAFRLAVEHMEDHRLARLQQILQEADVSSDFEHILALNQDFHRTIYTACKKPHLVQMIQLIHNKLAPYYRLYLDAGFKAEAWSEHRRMYDACVHRDPQLAEQATQAHSQRVCNKVLTVLRQGGVRTRMSEVTNKNEE